MRRLFLGFGLMMILLGHAQTQGWKQIGINDPAKIYGPGAGDLYQYGIGVIWDLKFEPQYASPKNTRLYATGVSSGLWLSPSGNGNDWVLLNTDFLPETSIGDFAINPKNRNRILIGTGLPKIRQSRNKDLFGLPKGKGIFEGNLKKNNKIKWDLIPNQVFHEGDIIKDNTAFWNEKTKCVAKLAYSIDGKTLVLAVIEEASPILYHTHIYTSHNSGADWFQKAYYPGMFLHDLDLDPTRNTHWVLSGSYQQNQGPHLFESFNEGDTWQPIAPNFDALNVEGCFYKTAFDNQQPARLWIAKMSPSANEIFIHEKGKELIAMRSFSQWHNAGGCSAFAISTISNDYYSIASVYMYRVDGAKYKQFYDEMHSDIRAIVYVPGQKKMMVANDGGVTEVIYNEASNNYEIKDVSKGLAIGRVTNISSVSSKNFGFSNWDNSCRWVYPNSKSIEFYDLFGNESTVFEMNENAILDGSAGPTNAILYTYDTSYSLSPREIYYGDFFTFFSNERRFLYISGTELHGVNYVASVSTDSIIYRHPQDDKYFLQPRIAPSDNNIIYTATQQQGAYYHFQIFKSMDHGKSWTEYNEQPYGGSISDIAINPTNPEKISVGSIQGEVFFSDNSGLTFQNSSLPAEAGPVNSIVYINQRWLLAACDNGLWVCNSNMFGEKVWRKFNGLLPRKANKLPDCRITDIEYLPKEGIIRAATMGRGVFECDVKKLF